MGVATLACNDQPTEPLPPVMGSASTLPTEGVPGWQLADTPKVVLLDDAGHPVAGVEVTWTVREGGGSVVPVNTVTDADGISAAVWTLGPTEGMNRLRASTLAGGQVDFEALGEVFRVDRLAANGGVGCGLVSSAIWCWGGDFWIKAPPVSSMPHTPVLTASLLDDSRVFQDLAVSVNVVCAVDQAGVGLCADEGTPHLTPVPGLPIVRRISGASSVSSGSKGLFCAVADVDSTAWCWRADQSPAKIVNSPAFVDLAVASSGPSSYRACGLLADSSAACWGSGALGDGNPPSDTLEPALVSGGHAFAELAVGTDFTCGRTADTDIWCWGETRAPGPSGALIPALRSSGAFAIAATWDIVGALTTPGTSVTWRGAFGADYVLPENTNIQGMPVVRYAKNSLDCLQMAGGGVYCGTDLVNGSHGGDTFVPFQAFVPLQPVRTEQPNLKPRIVIESRAR